MAIKDDAMTALRQAGQGLTFGFSDEIIDTAMALHNAQKNGTTFEQEFDKLRKESLANIANDWKESPLLSVGANLAGGLPLGFTRGAAALSNWSGTGSNLARLAKGFATGAGGGAIAGVGMGGDSVSDRIESGLFGAGLGGVGGALLSQLARPKPPTGSGPDFNKVTAKTAKGFSNQAEKDLAKKLAARPDLRDQLARAEVINKAAKESGIDLTLAEKIAQSSSDPLLAEQAVLGSNPMTAGRLENLYAARSGTEKSTGQIEDALLRHVRQLTGGKDAYEDVAQSLVERSGKASRDITKSLSAKAKPLYEEAYKVKVPNKEVSALIKQEPIIKNAINQAKRDERFSAALKGKSRNSVEVLDAAKKIIDEKITQGRNPAAPFNTSAYSEANRKLLGLTDQYAPTYSQARNVYSDSPEQLLMRERIGAVASTDPLQLDKVSNQLFSGTRRNAELAAEALGPEGSREAAAARILRSMDKSTNDPVNYATKIRPDPVSSDILDIYTGGDKALNQTLDVINRTKLVQPTRMGSRTQSRMQAEQGLAEGAVEAAADLATGGVSGALRTIGGTVAKMVGRGTPESDPQFYADMADLMLTDRGMDLLRRVALGQQNAIQELQTSIRPAISSAVAPFNPVLSKTGVMPWLAPEPEQNMTPIEQPNSFTPNRLSTDRMNELERLILSE